MRRLGAGPWTLAAPAVGWFPGARRQETATRSDVVKASVGDRLVIEGHHVGEPDRDAEILDVRGENGGPPYLVRWDDDGHEGPFFPGSDVIVDHIPHAASS